MKYTDRMFQRNTLVFQRNTQGFTEKGAIASMNTGFLCVPIFKFGMTRIPEIGMLFEKMDVLLPSFVISMIAGYVVSRIDRPQQGQTLN